MNKNIENKHGPSVGSTYMLCPFCGSEPYLEKWTEKEGGLSVDMARVCCECGASGPEGYGDFREKHATDRWNKRA